MEQSYKEKYEQALAKAKEQYNYPCMRSCMGILEEIFPELKESEDERVRKWLITQLELKSDVNNPHDLELMILKSIAWLERQGEHANFLSKIQVGDKVTRNENGVLVNLSQLKRVAKPSEKQCEQKPNGGIVREDFREGDGWYKVNLDYLSKEQVEEIEQLVEKWNPKEVSEEEKIKKAILIYLDWLDGKKDYLPKGDYTIKDMILWLERQGEQKTKENKGNIGEISAEWSENDKAFLDDILCKLEHDLILNKDEKDWLKSLKDRVQQKQEWGEDDKRRIDRIYSILRQAADTHAFSTSCRLIGDKECMDLQDFLKSLRPQNHWKPSETDIMILEKVFNGKIDPKDFQVTLSNVLEQLKKLKEE